MKKKETYGERKVKGEGGKGMELPTNLGLLPTQTEMSSHLLLFFPQHWNLAESNLSSHSFSFLFCFFKGITSPRGLIKPKPRTDLWKPTKITHLKIQISGHVLMRTHQPPWGILVCLASRKHWCYGWFITFLANDSTYQRLLWYPLGQAQLLEE